MAHSLFSQEPSELQSTEAATSPAIHSSTVIPPYPYQPLPLPCPHRTLTRTASEVCRVATTEFLTFPFILLLIVMLTMDNNCKSCLT